MRDDVNTIIPDSNEAATAKPSVSPINWRDSRNVDYCTALLSRFSLASIAIFLNIGRNMLIGWAHRTKTPTANGKHASNYEVTQYLIAIGYPQPWGLYTKAGELVESRAMTSIEKPEKLLEPEVVEKTQPDPESPPISTQETIPEPGPAIVITPVDTISIEPSVATEPEPTVVEPVPTKPQPIAPAIKNVKRLTNAEMQVWSGSKAIFDGSDPNMPSAIRWLPADVFKFFPLAKPIMINPSRVGGAFCKYPLWDVRIVEDKPTTDLYSRDVHRFVCGNPLSAERQVAESKGSSPYCESCISRTVPSGPYVRRAFVPPRSAPR